MDDVLRAVDLDRRPVALHGGDLAAGDAPQQTGAVQVIQRARWMTSDQGQRRGTSARPSMARVIPDQPSRIPGPVPRLARTLPGRTSR
jgi:hypothetical protein